MQEFKAVETTVHFESHQVAWRSLLTVHAILTKRVADGLADGGGLSYGDYDVLLTLNESPGRRLRLSELAELTLLSHSGISRCVTRLEAEGMLRRERCETDGRGFYAALTRSGREALRKTWPNYRAIIEEDFANSMTAAEAEKLAAIFHRMIVRLGSPRFHATVPQRMTDAPAG